MQEFTAQEIIQYISESEKRHQLKFILMATFQISIFRTR